jgi:hypothetical protein
VYDSKKDHFLMFGGYYTSGSTYYPRGDTWRMEEKTPNIYEWGWVEMSSVNAPEARFFHAMTYDDVEDRVILFGGAKGDIESYSNTLGDTYQHDGTNWSKKSIVDYHDDDQAGGGPSPRWGSVMAYDSDRGMSIMFGGRGEVSLNESWEYMEDKYSWRYLPAADAEGDGNPVERFNASMIYDDYNHELVMMGGSTDTFSGLADTWVGRYDISKRPAHLAHFRFAAAGYCEMPDVNKVNIDWVTGANGFSSTNGTKNGAYLRMWSKGEWLSPTNVYNGSLYPSPSNLSWSTSDAATIKQMLIGDEKTAHFVVFPRGINHNTKQNQVPPSNNDGLARITTDYVQYKVTYRLGADDHSQCE